MEACSGLLLTNKIRNILHTAKKLAVRAGEINSLTIRERFGILYLVLAILSLPEALKGLRAFCVRLFCD